MWWRSRQVIAGAAFLAVGLLFWCSRTPAVPVEAAAAAESALTVEVTTNGKIEPVAKAGVRARFSGRVIEIPDPGARISAGEIVLRLDDDAIASDLATAKSERLAAEDSLRKAQDSYARVRRRYATDQKLYKQNGITAERWRESQADLKQAKARVEFLENEVPVRVNGLDLRIAELGEQLEGAVVRAPFDGTVYQTEAKPGETVLVGEPVLWFTRLEELRVRANVDQVDLGRVTVGQNVEVSANAFPGRTWSARISEIIPNVVVKESRFVAEGLAVVDPPTEGLVPGMTVDVKILVDEVPSALQVPAEAIFTDSDGSFVYRIDDGRAHETRVSVGRSTVATIEIVGGLEGGDQVVIGPANGIADGVRVEVTSDG